VWWHAGRARAVAEAELRPCGVCQMKQELLAIAGSCLHLDGLCDTCGSLTGSTFCLATLSFVCSLVCSISLVHPHTESGKAHAICMVMWHAWARGMRAHR
jgi:hypothetical protein